MRVITLFLALVMLLALASSSTAKEEDGLLIDRLLASSPEAINIRPAAAFPPSEHRRVHSACLKAATMCKPEADVGYEERMNNNGAFT